MQTFLPEPSFYLSAQTLDKKRALKQVLEAHQILNTLAGKSKAWVNHPATRMWRGYEAALTEYYNVFWQYCKDFHKIKFDKLKKKDMIGDVKMPEWFGCEAFHSTHRARLLDKNIQFYSIYNWKESPSEGYNFWPVQMDGSLHPIVQEEIFHGYAKMVS